MVIFSRSCDESDHLACDLYQYIPMIGVVVLLHTVLLLSALFFGWYIFALIVGLVGVLILVVSFSHVLARATVSSPHDTQQS